MRGGESQERSGGWKGHNIIVRVFGSLAVGGEARREESTGTVEV